MSSYLVTTPIYYVNSDPHIGHAYTNIIAGCIKEWHSIQDSDTFLLTGTDEHGQKVQSSAEKCGQNTKDFVDYYSKIFRDLADVLYIPYDDFIRTTEDRHKTVVREIWKILEKNGYIYLGEYEGWYSLRDEAFFDDSELIDGKAPTGAEVHWRKEESYFFALSRFETKLLAFYEQNPDFIIPETRRNEVINFVKSGLRDLSISRTNFSWGVEVPGSKNHVVYVWIDALVNYISALGFCSSDDSNYKKFWEQSRKIHVIGKDILRFHAVYWPAILMACDLGLPTQLITHGWWTKRGADGESQKISKSLGNTIDPFELIKKFGVDYTKYFFLTANSISSDGEYDEVKFVDKINSDLVNNFGNLLSRVTNLIVSACNCVVSRTDEESHQVLNSLKLDFVQNYKSAMDNYRFDSAAHEIMNFSSVINKFIDTEKPWVLAKSGSQEKLNAVLFVSIDMIRVLSITLFPFIPVIVGKIASKLNFENFIFRDVEKVVNEYRVNEKMNLFLKVAL